MGKRSNFVRNERDFYITPYQPVLDLLPFLPPKTRFADPCVGDGALVGHLERHGHKCSWGSDIEDRAMQKYPVADALSLRTVLKRADCIITNPPWTRTKKNPILHQMIEHFRQLAPTWLLFDADWAHTKQAIPFLPYCEKIISIGRVKWIADSKSTGKDNCCWYLFTDKKGKGPKFFGRNDRLIEPLSV